MSSSIKKLNVVVNGLSPDSKYIYLLTNRGGNWPVKVSSLSGVLSSSSVTQNHNIATYVEFCPTTGLCPPSVSDNIFYNTPLVDPNAGVDVDRTNLYSIIGVSIYNDTNELVLFTESIAECDQCLPSLSLTGPSDLILNTVTSNSSTLNIEASNLIPNQKYIYTFDVTDSNWPIQISPISGVIQTSSSSYDLKTKVRFCANDDCENALDHTQSPNCDKGQTPTASVKVTLRPERGSYQTATSYDLSIICDDCIKYTMATIPDMIELTNFTKNQAIFNVTLSNLIIGKNYQYVVNGMDANWPFIISPISGSIVALDSNMVIPIKVIACASTGLCDGTRSDVLDYSSSSVCSSNYGVEDKHAHLRISVSPSDGCDTINSNQLRISCDNCLPKAKISLPSSIINLNYPVLKYTGAISISDLIPGQQYNFSLFSNDSNWPTKLYPQSGSFVADSSTRTIPINMSFCSSTGLYPAGSPDILPFVLTPESIQNKNFKTTIRASISPNDCTALDAADSNSLSLVCDECAPKTTASASPDINLTSTTQNKGSFSLSFTNLIPGSRYTYTLNSLDANWPVIVSPVSGTIVSSSSSMTLPIGITFCRATGLCPTSNPKVLPYTLDQACLLNYNTVNKYIKLQANLNNIDDSTGDTILSNIINIECDDCLPKTRVTLPSSTVLTDAMESSSINALIYNVIPGQQYKFDFYATNSSWPTRLNPQSGTFVPDTTTFTMPFDVTFCRSTGVCPDNVLPFTLDTTDNTHSTAIRLKVQPNNCNALESVDSNISTIVCRQCIPLARVSLPGSNIILNNNVYNTTGVVHNLVSGQKYDYSIDTIYSNWPTTAYPQSGTFVADSSSVNIPLQLSFCRSTGVCPQGASNVLPFTLENSCNYVDGKDIKTTITLSVKSNNSSALPKISSNGMTISCSNCLPTIKASGSPLLTLTSSNTSTTNLTISNTIPGRQYSYSTIGLGANWPVMIYPMSGIVTATSTTTTVPLKLSFCRSSGICPDTDSSIIPYSIKPSTYYGPNLDRSARFKFLVTDLDCNLSIQSNESVATCENCISNTSLTNAVSTTVLSSAGTTRYQLVTSGQNLVPGERYTYSVNYVDANWPTVVYPQSGSFVASSNSKIITTDIQFCFPSGSCNNVLGSMPYTGNSASNNRYVKLNISLEDPTIPNAPVRTDDFTVSCANCFPSINYSIFMSGAPNLVLPLSCCTGTRIMKVDVTGAIPGDRHSYFMGSSSSNITFSPESGSLFVRPNGSGTFFNMMTSTMPSGTSAIVTCKIVNESSNIESTEFMVVRCSTGC